MNSREQQLWDLGRIVAVAQDDARASSDLSRARRHFLQHVDDTLALQESRKWSFAGWRDRILMPFAWATAITTVLVLGGTWLVMRWERPLAFTVQGQPEARVGDWLAAPEHAPMALSFSDGSRVELAPQARGRVLDVDANGSHVMLERGAAAVKVTKGPDTHWRFSVGPFVVDVLGTRFDLAWDPERDDFTLRLAEGRVSVSGCNFREGRLVLPGETVRASCVARRFEVTSEANTTKTAAAEEATPEQEETHPKRGPRRAARRMEAKVADWREIARGGDYSKALALVETTGFERVLSEASAADLALLGDVARLGHQYDRALSAYQAVRRRFAGTMASSTAAYHIARLYFDRLGAYSRAAEWFEIYLTEQPQGGLAREATGRWLESLQRSGNQAGARRVAERYLQQHPQGPHAPLARSIVRP